MFLRKEPTTLDLEILARVAELKNQKSDSGEYAKIVDQLVKLNAIKANQPRPRISPDTLATIAANLIGIVLILRYERIDIITSKAMSMIQKPK